MPLLLGLTCGAATLRARSLDPETVTHFPQPTRMLPTVGYHPFPYRNAPGPGRR